MKIYQFKRSILLIVILVHSYASPPVFAQYSGSTGEPNDPYLISQNPKTTTERKTGERTTPVSRAVPDDLVLVSAEFTSLSVLASGSREAQERQRQAVDRLNLPLEVKSRKTGIAFRLIPAGCFTMGSPKSEQDAGVKAGAKRKYVELEVMHQVEITKPFYCGKYEVTQGQWQAVMGSNPSKLTDAGQDAPVEQVSWDDCQAFLKKLCQMEGVAKGTYRLLTEAEWEYACRAGTETALYNGELVIKGQKNGPAIGPIGWYGGNSGVSYSGGYDSSGWKEKQFNHEQAGTHPVGLKLANSFGLYDMIGNVYEWCHDTRSRDSRVTRGGSWSSSAWYCRSAKCDWMTPGNRWPFLGLRLARTAPSNP
ncbi:formylglycine-generating enzyme family protein [Planctomycetota bacterium]